MDDELAARLAANLSANLRYLRDQRGLTQAKLGTAAGVPRSTVANLETGSGNPTLTVLARLANALQVTTEELLTAPRGLGQHHPAGSLPVRTAGTRGSVVVHQLLPQVLPGLAFERMVLRAGGVMAGVPHRSGTREYLYCERGQLQLRVAGEPYVLEPGDVVSFRGDLAHSYANHGDVEAVGMSVVAVTLG